MLKNNIISSSLNTEDEFILQNIQAIELQIKLNQAIPEKTIKAILDKWYWAVQVIYGDEYQNSPTGEFYFKTYYQAVLLLAEKGVGEAQYKLFLYHNKIEQHSTALKWLKKAVENDHLLSMFDLIRIYCEIDQTVLPDIKSATALGKKFLERIQKEYGIAFAEQNVDKSNLLLSLHEEVIRFLEKIDLFSKKDLNKNQEVSFLCNDKIMLITVHALNDLIQNNHTYIDKNKSKWQLANTYDGECLKVDKNNPLPVRPMGIITFHFEQEYFSKNNLYLYLQEMGITCHQIDVMSGAAIFSIDNEKVVKKVPAQCKNFSCKIIEDYLPSTSTNKNSLQKQEHALDNSGIKHFLINTKSTVNDPKWNNKAYGLFSYYIPPHIQHLRDELKNFHDQLSVSSIFSIFEKVKKEINTINPKNGRDPELNDYYNQLKKDVNDLLNPSLAKTEQYKSFDH